CHILNLIFIVPYFILHYYYILFLNGHHLYIDNFLEDLRDLSDVNKANVKFSLRNPSQPDDDVCYIVRGKPETLSSCNFKNLFCHSWVSGLFESWKDANVIVVDWLDTAQNYYALAAQNTKMVGQEIGLFIDWLELHLLGYSLGAHIAGFAGSHATNKVGRITGLDPAGPNFEGVHAHRRLSPDDAHFVDVLHTFTRGSLGLSIGIGIEQPVGHVDIYPNGGSFQPGCNLRGALEKIANYGILGKDPYLGNSHERSVQLFIDSLLNEGEASRAYICGSNDMFNCGMCLQCHKNRRHIVGYDASKVRKARSIKMFTKTRGSLPFRGQCQVSEEEFKQFCSLTVSLYGTNGEAEALKLNITANKTYSFLVVTEKDIGDLLMLKFKLKESTSSLLSLVRAGETQKKYVFNIFTRYSEHKNSAQDVVFVTCKEPWRSLSKR
uniref:PLAT domain-containing protein n=1 Tax=Cyprinus carpio TaxID=7962 RepID=A0A8C1XFY7_CYPCA